MKLNEPLVGKRIVIRNYEKSNLKFLTDMWFDEQNGKYMSDPTIEYVDDSYQSILDDLENSEDGYYLVVELANSGVPIGSAGIFPTEDGIYDIGYCVHKSKWQRWQSTICRLICSCKNLDLLLRKQVHFKNII